MPPTHEALRHRRRRRVDRETHTQGEAHVRKNTCGTCTPKRSAGRMTGSMGEDRGTGGGERDREIERELPPEESLSVAGEPSRYLYIVASTTTLFSKGRAETLLHRETCPSPPPLSPLPTPWCSRQPPRQSGRNTWQLLGPQNDFSRLPGRNTWRVLLRFFTSAGDAGNAGAFRTELCDSPSHASITILDRDLPSRSGNRRTRLATAS